MAYRRSFRRSGSPVVGVHLSRVARAFTSGLAAALLISILTSATGTPHATAVTAGHRAGGGGGIACARVAPSPRKGSALDVKVSLGGVRARLQGRSTTAQGVPALHSPTISFTTSSGSFRSVVRPPAQASVVSLSPIGDTHGADEPLCVVRFSHHVVTPLIGFYTGGAHCCVVVRAYSRRDGHWGSTDDNLGNAGATVQLVDKTPVVVTQDSRFAYEFTDYVNSGMPIVVTRFEGGHFVTVTHRYPWLIQSDAGIWWQDYQRNPHDPLGYLAAWTADECAVGQGSRAFAQLASLQADEKLVGPDASRPARKVLGTAATGERPVWPTEGAYVHKLRTFLVSHGYCNSSIST